MLKEVARSDTWVNWHHYMMSFMSSSNATVVVFRDSNVKNLLDKKCNLDTLKISIRKESLFLGQGGDKIENL